MRIHDQDGNPLTGVHLALTNREAKELRDALEDLVQTQERGWHVHVADDAYQVDVTVYRSDDPEMVF